MIRTLLVALSLTLLTAFPAAAFEATGNAVADAFLRIVEAAGFAPASAAEVSRRENAVVLTGVAAGGAGRERGLRIGTVEVVGGAVDADNALSAQTIAYQDLTFTDAAQEPTAVIGTVRLTAPVLALPQEADGGALSLVGQTQTVLIEALDARSESGQSLKVGSLSASRPAEAEPGVHGGTLDISDLDLDLSLLDETAAGQLRALGYEALMLDLSASGEWAAADGRVHLSDARLSAAGMGAVEMSAAGRGLTSTIFDELRAGDLDFAKLVDLLGTVRLSSLAMAFQDDGLTARLLELGASREKITVEAMRERVLASLSQGLSTLQDTTFRERVVAAAGRFLAEPGRIEARAEPQKEVTALEVLGAAMLNPQLLPRLLALEITAQ